MDDIMRQLLQLVADEIDGILVDGKDRRQQGTVNALVAGDDVLVEWFPADARPLDPPSRKFRLELVEGPNL